MKYLLIVSLLDVISKMETNEAFNAYYAVHSTILRKLELNIE